MERRNHRVSEQQAGLRLDRFLQSIQPDQSRAYWQRQIGAGRVLINGRQEKAGYLLRAGQEVSVSLSDDGLPEPLGLLPDGTPATLPDWVLYQDADILVVNKPRGLVVHPSLGHWEDSLVHRLLPWLPHEAGEWRPGVVHRLDRDTSGLMLLARTRSAREALSLAIQERRVTRQYVAVVRGRLDPADGLIDAPLARDPRQRLRMAVVFGGREARTHYHTVAFWPGLSLVALTLDTGRTHQIRVHLASVGHPVAGDPLYGGRLPEFRHGQLLHASRLAFHHPVTGQPLAFTAPPPPDWHTDLSLLGDPEIVAPFVFGDGVEPTTHQWLSELFRTPS